MKKQLRSLPGRLRERLAHPSRRLGSIILLSTAVLIMILAFTVFSVDVGYIALSKGQMQNAVDAAALAAVQELDPNIDQEEALANAVQAAKDIAKLHRAGDQAEVSIDGNLGNVEFGRRRFNFDTQKYDYQWGPNATPYNMVRVTARRSEVLDQEGNVSEDNQLPLFFGPVLGASGATLETSAIATFQPRDIMLVLDYSGSMNDDSELRSINKLGQQAIEDNIELMWQELGSPTYGNMNFTPKWVRVPYTEFDIDVEWKTDEVRVRSDESGNIQQVRLYFSTGNSQTFGQTSSKDKTYKGSGGNSGDRITKVRIKYDDDTETVDFYSNSDIRRGLGLNNVSYPYPSGSWDDYIEYARSHSSNMPWYDRDVFSAGYRRQFGMLTLINFWNKNKDLYSETPDLWKVSQQPITALKNSVDVLIDYLVTAAADDYVGLSVYTFPGSAGAKLEKGLGTNFNSIKTISRQRQAGHYQSNTNIGAGMRTARLELENNSRSKTLKLMVLMTDGLANASSTSASPKNFALDEAYLAKAANIKIMTISLGTGADEDLMQDIANISGGKHFNVPGGQGVAQYVEELQQVFGEIAADRPLKIVEE